jgi:hypothetical protein
LELRFESGQETFAKDDNCFAIDEGGAVCSAGNWMFEIAVHKDSDRNP